MITHQGAEFLDPVDLIARAPDRVAEEAGRRLHEMVLTETDYAIPAPDARVRALTTQGTRRGDLAGEAWRSSLMFMSFPITVAMIHLGRGVRQNRGFWSGAGYLGSVFITTTVLGGIVIEAKQTLAGKDPLAANDWRFWGAAFAQGGGLGIFGDFLYDGLTRTGHGTGGGPLAGLGHDAKRLFLPQVRKAFEDGDDITFGAEMVRFVDRYMPGTSLWFARTALDRLVWDQLRRMADPDAERAFRRMQHKALRQYGQEYWWRPGDVLPHRPPDPGAAVGGRR